MVTKSTPNTRAKKTRAATAEKHRQDRPCPFCGESLNTLKSAIGHTKADCTKKQKENAEKANKTSK